MRKHEKHEKQQEKHKKSEVGRIIAIWSASTHRGQCAPKSTVGSWHVWHLIGYGLKVWNKTAVWTFTWISEMRCLLCDLQPIDPDPFLNLSMFVPCRPEMVEHCAKRPCKFVSMSGLPHGLWDPRWILRNYPATPRFKGGVWASQHQDAWLRGVLLLCTWGGHALGGAMLFRTWARRVPFAQWNGEERVPLSNFHVFFSHSTCMPTFAKHTKHFHGIYAYKIIRPPQFSWGRMGGGP